MLLLCGLGAALLGLVEHLHLRQPRLVVLGGLRLHAFVYLHDELAHLLRLAQFGTGHGQQHAAALVVDALYAVGSQGTKGVVLGLLPLTALYGQLGVEVVDVGPLLGTGLVAHGQQCLVGVGRGAGQVVAALQLHAGKVAERGQVVAVLLDGVVAVVGVGLCGHLLGLVVVAEADAGLGQPLARHGHEQRVGRAATVAECLLEVALRLGVVAHRLVELAHVVVEDTGRLQPLVVLEDGQRLLIVGNGQVGLVLHIVEVADGAVERGVAVVDGLLVVFPACSHRVGDGHRLLVVAEGRVVVAAAVGYHAEDAPGVDP